MSHLAPADLNILLVEPSQTQRKVISRHLLDEEIHHVEEAGSIAEAKAKLALSKPDLIASALHFADGTGLDLIRELKRDAELQSIPFMLVSSEQRKDELEAFKQAGVVAILPKPFTREHLGRALNATIDFLSAEELQLELYDVQDVRVLIVDDSRLARNHIRRVLTNLGMSRFTEAEDGKQAIAELSNSMFDLVVTDYNMPEVNGQELAEFIRSSAQHSHIPVLMVSSEANESHLANIRQSGVNALCDKPFEPETVRRLLYQLLDHPD